MKGGNILHNFVRNYDNEALDFEVKILISLGKIGKKRKEAMQQYPYTHLSEEKANELYARVELFNMMTEGLEEALKYRSLLLEEDNEGKNPIDLMAELNIPNKNEAIQLVQELLRQTVVSPEEKKAVLEQLNKEKKAYINSFMMMHGRIPD